MEALKEQVRGWYVAGPPEKETTAKGHQYTVILSPKAKERKITNIRKLARTIKDDTFWTVCTVSMGAIDRLTTAEQRATFLTESQTGSRTVKAVPNTQETK
jgi:hypothetical protein